MCHLCDQDEPHLQATSRPDPVTASTAPLAAAPAETTSSADETSKERAPRPRARGVEGERTVIRGGIVLTMDQEVGDFVSADILIDGKRILDIRPGLDVADAEVIDASGKIVMPGFVDTHHHQFETALRSFLADGLLFNDGRPQGAVNYFDYVLHRFAPVYRPEDVYINELFGSLAQLDAGVTTVLDVSQIHHSPEHSDAAVKGLADSGRRCAFGYFEGQGEQVQYPGDARRLKRDYFSSDDQLLTMVMGGEIYLPGYEAAWAIGRELGILIALHVVGSLGMAETFNKLAADGQFGPDNLFIHMTGMSDLGWRTTSDSGAAVSLSVPIEMTMRHGIPPILKSLAAGVQPSLSTDVECTMTADFFTQMRATMTLQRALVNEKAIGGDPDLPDLLTSRDVIRFATIEGAKSLRLDKKIGTLTPGKEADLILLDADAVNVAPLNHVAGAVVTLMERSNVEAVMVAGRLRKWQGRLLDVDLARLRQELLASRDYLFAKAGVERDLFRA